MLWLTKHDHIEDAFFDRDAASFFLRTLRADSCDDGECVER